MLAELRHARADGNAERFRRAAHSLKSNANTFGAVSLAAQARELELKGLDAEPDRDEAALAALEVGARAYRRRLEGLAQWLSKGPAC